MSPIVASALAMLGQVDAPSSDQRRRRTSTPLVPTIHNNKAGVTLVVVVVPLTSAPRYPATAPLHYRTINMYKQKEN